MLFPKVVIGLAHTASFALSLNVRNWARAEVPFGTTVAAIDGRDVGLAKRVDHNHRQSSRLAPTLAEAMSAVAQAVP